MQAVLPHMLGTVRGDRQHRLDVAQARRPGGLGALCRGEGAVLTMTLGVARESPIAA